MIRWGLCCTFLDVPIRFRTATHRYVSSLAPADGRAYLAAIALHNANALRESVEWCAANGVGAFRITSQLLPLATHPQSGYDLDDLGDDGAAPRGFAEAAARARALDVRLTFHPDQFVVLNSEAPHVVASAIGELEFQAGLAERLGADVLTLHAGGSAGGTEASLARLALGVAQLSARARSRIALENDDRRFAPRDLLPFCETHGIPLVYDVHHHRCHPDGMSVEEATARAVATWQGREPSFHISSPRDGWDGSHCRAHAGLVDPADFPAEWHRHDLTVDVEAKEKERAVLALAAAVAGAPADRASSPRGPVRPLPPAAEPGGCDCCDPTDPAPDAACAAPPESSSLPR